MKLLSKRRVFFNGEIINIGQEFEYTGDMVPSWANEVVELKNNEDKYVQTQLPLDKISLKDLDNITANNTKSLEIENQHASELLQKELDELITKGLEQEIMLEDVEEKTIQQQINELKTKLKEV